MKVIYYGDAAAYAAYGMAAIHLGIYNENEVPHRDDIMKQWKSCLTSSIPRGNLVYMGLDEMLREVYVIGCGSHGRMVKKAYKGFGELYEIHEDILYIDTGPWEGGARILASLSKNYPLIEPIARRIYIRWFKRIYPLWSARVRKGWEMAFKGEMT